MSRYLASFGLVGVALSCSEIPLADGDLPIWQDFYDNVLTSESECYTTESRNDPCCTCNKVDHSNIYVHCHAEASENKKYITSIHMEDNNLEGTVPEAVFEDLGYLISLKLNENPGLKAPTNDGCFDLVSLCTPNEVHCHVDDELLCIEENEEEEGEEQEEDDTPIKTEEEVTVTVEHPDSGLEIFPLIVISALAVVLPVIICKRRRRSSDDSVSDFDGDEQDQINFSNKAMNFSGKVRNKFDQLFNRKYNAGKETLRESFKVEDDVIREDVDTFENRLARF
eukprot:maker-scaffold_6-snap-gene-18.38-mRNA-1 protein AED:0.00 eAED:0.00 QI:321/1/1/1/1/1/2/109/281